MKTITVFLASSNELNYDRNSFQALIAKLDDIYEPRGIRIKCRRWEDFPAYCTGERTQDVYNKTVRSCDMCICMFHKEAGQYTIEEFEQALDEYRTNHSHPKTFVYIRALVEGEVETDELKAFKDQLFKSIGHYWCNYACDDSMNLHFVMQLERLIPDMGLSAGDSSQLKVEEGNVTLQGIKIADYTNLPFAAANPEYCNLKEKYAQLDKDITQLRALGIDDTHDLLREKVIDRQKCHEQIINMEKQLLDMAFQVNKSISSNSPMSERKRLAIEMFEQGNIKGVINVLNEEDMVSEAKQAELEIARGRQLVQSGNDLIEKGIQTIQAQVEEYILRAKALMLDFDNADRFSLACNAYERAVELTRNHLSQAELAYQLNEYYCFLSDNNQFTKCEAYIEESVSIRAELCREHPEMYEPDLAVSYNNLANLYGTTQRFHESEAMYKSALAIYERLAKENPQSNEPDLADSYNNLAVLYYNLALLYYNIQHYNESEAMYKSALAIRERLAKEIPQIYEPDLATSYNNLANLYSDTQRFEESESMHKSAIAIRERLAKANPQAYEPDLAASYNNLAIVYYCTERIQECEELFKATIAIREHLAEGAPQEYGPALAQAYSNLAILYNETQRYAESEAMANTAAPIRERLGIE